MTDFNNGRADNRAPIITREGNMVGYHERDVLAVDLVADGDRLVRVFE